jgi:hypothetical protein
MNRLLCLVLLLLPFASVRAAGPDCSSPTDWAAMIAFTKLRNAGLITATDPSTVKTTVVRLASERIGKDVYRQVHKITFRVGSGHDIEVITVNDAALEECSASGVEVLVVGRDLGNL